MNSGRKRWHVWIMAVLGVLAGVALVAYYGVAAVGSALAVAGWSGLAYVTLFHLLPLGLCAVAWRALLQPPPATIVRYSWFRLARDAGGILPVGGPILGIRAMKLAGIDLNRAAGSTVVDCTLELAAQLVFTLCGVMIVLVEGSNGATVGWALAAMAVLALFLLGFALAQRFGPLRSLASRVPGLAWFPLARLADVQDCIHRIYADRSVALRAFALHLAAWFVSIGEAGVALYMLGLPLGLGSLLALESLGCALRGAAFFVPGAAGVQEGGYVVLGGLFGVGPETALSLSLLKRGRELLLTAFAFVLWQAAEGGGAWRRLRARPQAAGRAKVLLRTTHEKPRKES
jgi:putative membrane protein